MSSECANCIIKEYCNNNKWCEIKEKIRTKIYTVLPDGKLKEGAEVRKYEIYKGVIRPAIAIGVENKRKKLKQEFLPVTLSPVSKCYLENDGMVEIKEATIVWFDDLIILRELDCMGKDSEKLKELDCMEKDSDKIKKTITLILKGKCKKKENYSYRFFGPCGGKILKRTNTMTKKENEDGKEDLIVSLPPIGILQYKIMDKECERIIKQFCYTLEKMEVKGPFTCPEEALDKLTFTM